VWRRRGSDHAFLTFIIWRRSRCSCGGGARRRFWRTQYYSNPTITLQGTKPMKPLRNAPWSAFRGHLCPWINGEKHENPREKNIEHTNKASRLRARLLDICNTTQRLRRWVPSSYRLEPCCIWRSRNRAVAMVEGWVGSSGVESKTVVVVNAEWTYIHTGYTRHGCLSYNLHPEQISTDRPWSNDLNLPSGSFSSSTPSLVLGVYTREGNGNAKPEIVGGLEQQTMGVGTDEVPARKIRRPLENVEKRIAATIFG
jgi:hypothetical protein